MSYGKPLRQQVENLILGKTGDGRMMELGRFHLKSPDARLERHPFDSAERAFEVVIRPGRNLPEYPPNEVDGLRFALHSMTVRVAYALTNAGGDGIESVTEQDGPGTIDAVRDRAITDANDIEMVLQDYQNWDQSLDPLIIDMGKTDGEEPADVLIVGNLAILEIPFTLMVRATIPSASPPSDYAP